MKWGLLHSEIAALQRCTPSGVLRRVRSVGETEQLREAASRIFESYQQSAI